VFHALSSLLEPIHRPRLQPAEARLDYDLAVRERAAFSEIELQPAVADRHALRACALADRYSLR
jgi:hypothetical protein